MQLMLLGTSPAELLKTGALVTAIAVTLVLIGIWIVYRPGYNPPPPTTARKRVVESGDNNEAHGD